jgi:Domain of unknown function (DUF3303)
LLIDFLLFQRAHVARKKRKPAGSRDAPGSKQQEALGDWMKFAVFWNVSEDVHQVMLSEIMAERSSYEYPEGVKLVTEYYALQRKPAVISILEADEVFPQSLAVFPWMSMMTATVVPIFERDTRD